MASMPVLQNLTWSPRYTEWSRSSRRFAALGGMIPLLGMSKFCYDLFLFLLSTQISSMFLTSILKGELFPWLNLLRQNHAISSLPQKFRCTSRHQSMHVSDFPFFYFVSRNVVRMKTSYGRGLFSLRLTLLSQPGVRCVHFPGVPGSAASGKAAVSTSVPMVSILRLQLWVLKTGSSSSSFC